MSAWITKPHVRLINSHAKGVGSDYDLQFAAMDEALLGRPSWFPAAGPRERSLTRPPLPASELRDFLSSVCCVAQYTMAPP